MPLSSPSYVTTNIKAFRTITTFLGAIPRTKPINVVDNLSQEDDPTNRQEIRILDALSQIVVSEHDVSAMVTDRAFGSDTKLHIVSCVDRTAFNSRTPSDPSSKSSTWSLLGTRNYRRSAKVEIQPDRKIPKVVPSAPPKELQGRTALEYIRSLEEHW